MKTVRFIHAIAALLAFALRVSAQSGTNELNGRLGPDISGIETAKPATPLAPDTTPEKRPGGPTEITAREATFDNRTNLGIFNYDVIVRGPDFGLSCDRLTVTIKASLLKAADQSERQPKAVGEKAKVPGESGGPLEKAVAEGNVIITQDKPDGNGNLQRYTGKAKRAVFDNTTGTLTLYGWPQISQSIGGNINKQIVSLEESCVITLNRSGKIDVNGLHKTTFQDGGTLDQSRR